MYFFTGTGQGWILLCIFYRDRTLRGKFCHVNRDKIIMRVLSLFHINIKCLQLSKNNTNLTLLYSYILALSRIYKGNFNQINIVHLSIYWLNSEYSFLSSGHSWRAATWDLTDCCAVVIFINFKKLPNVGFPHLTSFVLWKYLESKIHFNQ